MAHVREKQNDVAFDEGQYRRYVMINNEATANN